MTERTYLRIYRIALVVLAATSTALVAVVTTLIARL